ncbi:hypothetical protein V6O07_05705 [Arthrospira platensis SPKY2]
MGDSSAIALVWGVSQLVSDLVRGNQLLPSRQLEEAVDGFQKAIAIPISQDFSNPARVVVGGL